MQATQEPKSTQAKNAANSHDPILTDEDEAFLRQVMSQPENAEPGASTTAAAPASGSGGDGGDAVPAAASPPPENTQEIEEFGKSLGEQQRRATSELKEGGGEGKKDEKEDKKEDKKEDEGKKDEGDAEKKKKRWSVNWPWKKGQKEKKEEKADEAKTDDKTTNAESSKDTPDAESQAKPDEETKAKAGEGETGTGTDDDMSEILEQLNLAAENNRIFSASDEMQELLRKFKLIFKDLINGVPTAYNDLEMLLKNGNRQLQDTYTRLPTFLQKLIEKLPEKWTDSLAPEIVAAASERAAKSGVNTENVGKAAAAAKKVGLQVPSLKELVGTPAAIVGMLRSIVAFLKARFPAVVGVNILWSLALSILLFVLWYCHKRGKEVRLENERIVTEQEIEKLNEQSANGERPIRPTETLTTTAPRGASADAIRDGVRQVEQSRETSGTDTPTPEQAAQGTNESTAGETAGSTADNTAADNAASDNAAADKSTTGAAATDAAAAGGGATTSAAPTSAAPTSAATGGAAESTTAGNTATTETPASETTAAGQNETPAEAPKRTKSKFGAWARSASKKVSSSKAEPYPGT